MSLELFVGPDHFSISEHGRRIPRPLTISRVRWLAFWRHVGVAGFDWLKVMRFLTGRRELTYEQMIELMREHDG